jgi:hypothetical protein
MSFGWRLALLLALVLAPASASTLITFDIPGTFQPNIAPDRYRSSGVLIDTTSSAGLCIGDILGESGFSRRLFTCNFEPSSLIFHFVDPVTLAPKPSSLFELSASFVLFQGTGTEWTLSLFDVDHNLLETSSGIPSTTSGGAGVHDETFHIFRPSADIASAEFLTASGPTTRTSVDDLRFLQVPEAPTTLSIVTGMLLVAAMRRAAA